MPSSAKKRSRDGAQRRRISLSNPSTQPANTWLRTGIQKRCCFRGSPSIPPAETQGPSSPERLGMTYLKEADVVVEAQDHNHTRHSGRDWPRYMFMLRKSTPLGFEGEETNAAGLTST